MQTHSMCALALATVIWHPYRSRSLEGVEIRVTPKGGADTKIYNLEDIEFDDLKFRCTTVRTHGGKKCQISGERISTLEGNLVSMTHSQFHIADLVEEFRLYPEKIVSGTHRGSKKYRNFDGYVADKEVKKIILNCEVRNSRDEFCYLEHTIELNR